VADDASNETILANGISAAKTGDMATAEKMEALLASKATAAPGGAATANPHADHGAAPASAEASAGRPAAAMAPSGSDAGKGVRIMHKELQALIAQAKGQGEQAIALLKEAVQIEETMRPPNGAADPIKPSHELLGEVLLQAGKPAEAAAAFDTTLLRMPNRARALMGAAKAYAAAGNRDLAAQRTATLNSFWKGKPFTAQPTDAR
jgi:tetratricopeptide (TPR) repeat protein